MEISNYIDLEDAAERFMKNDELFKKFLFRFPGEQGFHDLFKLLEEEQVEEAFKVAHSMKGVTANLALKSLNEALKPISDILKAKIMPGENEINRLKDAYEEVLQLIVEIELEGRTLFS